MTETSDIEVRIAERLKDRREELGLSLADLATRSGVSKAMISRIERREASPTAAILGRLCAGLDITLSGLMAAVEERALVLLKAEAQPQWRDPETGFERLAVSPAGTGSPVEIVQATLPPGAEISYPPLPAQGFDQHILGISGTLSLRSGKNNFVISAGDCLHCAPGQPHVFSNTGKMPARYLVIIARRMPR
jgi:transcriptional regulator with XRE-family HTH domain